MDSTSSKNHQCPHCGKSFTRKSGLRIHLPSHSKVRNFTCSKGCGKKFLRSNDRNRHERAQHGEKRFVCPGCEERFGRKDALSSHLRSNAGLTCRATTSGTKHSTTMSESQLAFPDTNATNSDSALHQLDESSQSTIDQPPRRYWSFTLLSTSALLFNEWSDRVAELLDDNDVQCNVCLQRTTTNILLAIHLMEHIVQWNMDSFGCPLCHIGTGFYPTLASHLQTHSSRECNLTICVRRNGKPKCLTLGCGEKFLDKEQAYIDHECAQLYSADRVLVLLAFEQLTDLWADEPQIITDLDKMLGCERFGDDAFAWETDPHWGLKGLHEQIKHDSRWEPIPLKLPYLQPSKRKEMRDGDGVSWRNEMRILECLETFPGTQSSESDSDAESSSEKA